MPAQELGAHHAAPLHSLIQPADQRLSRQAPAGFLDTAQLHGQVELEKDLGLIDPLDPNLQWLEL